jgi:hypothetical protein
MTRRGRIEARKQIYGLSQQESQSDPVHDSEEAHMDLAESHGFRSDNDPASDSQSDDEIFVDVDEISDEGDARDQLPEPGPESHNDALEEELGDIECKESELCCQAEAGLMEILNQYEISAQEQQNICAIFQQYITTAPRDLNIKPIDDNKRYPWAIVHQRQDGWEILADIALRLEVLVCREAISECTNGMMRRILAPSSLRMGRKTLLSRLMIAKHNDSGLERGSSRPGPVPDRGEDGVEERPE